MISTGSSCVTTDPSTDKAVALRAAAQAKVYRAPLPDVCREELQKVIPKDGEKWRSVQLRWEITWYNENEIKKMCAELYEPSPSRLAVTPGSLP